MSYNSINEKRQVLLKSIATIISDYRQGEISVIDPDHVNKWISQFDKFGFDSNGQIVILQEIERILNLYYISQSAAEAFIARILSSQKVFGPNPAITIPNTEFLRIQTKGNSQNDLLKLCKPILLKMYGRNLDQCIEFPTEYVYLDDCLYSGNRVRRDITSWLPSAINGTTLHLIFFAYHIYGYNYSKKNY